MRAGAIRAACFINEKKWLIACWNKGKYEICLGCWHIYSKIIIFANCFCNSLFLLALNSRWRHQFLLNSLAEHTKGHRNTWNIWCQERKYQKSSRNPFFWYKSTFSKQTLFCLQGPHKGTVIKITYMTLYFPSCLCSLAEFPACP